MSATTIDATPTWQDAYTAPGFTDHLNGIGGPVGRPMRVLVACEFSGAVRDAFMARGHYARSCDLLPTEAHHPVKFRADFGCYEHEQATEGCEECEYGEPYCHLHEMDAADCTCLGPTEDEAEYDEPSFNTWEPQGARHLTSDLFSMSDAELSFYDLLIAHPPCTYMANSGAKHLYIGMKKENGPEPKRWAAMRAGAEFFKRIWNLPIPRICIENPIMLGAAKEIIGAEPAQIIQPYQFGHPESKQTCLWLKGLPLLRETNNVKAAMLALPKKEAQRIHMLPPSPDRWKLRSATFLGIADAMASQWGLDSASEVS